MPLPQHRVFYGLVPLLALGCVTVATVTPNAPAPLTYITIGILLGTMFSHGLGTAWELPLVQRFQTGPGPNIGHILGINGVQVLWVLLVTGALRFGGYRLTRAGLSSRQASAS